MEKIERKHLGGINMPIVSSILSGLAQIPGIVCRYLPFKDSLNKKQKKTLFILYSIVMVVNMILFYVAQMLFGLDVLFYKFYFIMGGLMYLVINCYVMPKRITEHLFVYWMVAIYVLTLHSISAIFQNFFSIETTNLMRLIVQDSLFFVIFIVTYRILRKLIDVTVKPFIECRNGDYWKNMWVVPMFMFCSNFLMSINYTWLQTWDQILSRLFTSFAMIFICQCIAYDFKEMQSKIVVNEKLKFSEEQIRLQKNYYTAISRSMDDARKARHDFKHHKAAIERFIQTDDKKALMEYYNNIEKDASGVMLYTGNAAVDGVLYYYQQMAVKEGISIDIACKLDNDLNIKDIDLCSLFGNSVENAIEAAKYIQGEKHIGVRSQIDGKQLLITVDNTFDGTLKKRGDDFLSRKRNNEVGIGISSMRDVCEKYGGFCKFEAKGNIFMASFILTI